ncbi:maleylpyruvate isomerase family mycothiol-dependent enzyme [Actinokineospora inagensis]|uniref:maleylpyruvate isomerase family mycothiol-dependent enzyme n=1 Tax=Actinokineospora inagensis TaxID=103730 RepID=UPI000410B105|nr:maleylpyruvate isomerase family mycothiol-dependent enzyme [Actinokineospora inagensis]
MSDTSAHASESASTTTGAAASAAELPGQRRSDSASRAVAGHQAVREAWTVLHRVVAELPDPAYRASSTLPGWTRAHVVSHLARNADALVNLMTWARTGVEHPAYASRADRNADIADGAGRLVQVIREDLYAACDRFHTAAARLTDADWGVTVLHPSGAPISAAEVPELALSEAWNHLVDLDAGITYADIPAGHLDRLLDLAVRPRRARGAGTPLRLVADLPDGRQRTWELPIATPTSSRELSGPAAAVLGWLMGRTPGDKLAGTPPELDAWA